MPTVSLPAAANLAAAPSGVALDCLAARVRVDLGVEHQHVDVAAAGQDVVEAAVADVVGPAVAAHEPDALLDEVVGQRLEPRAPPGASSAASCLAQRAPRARAGRRCPPRSSWSASRSSGPRRSPMLRRQLLDEDARGLAAWASRARRKPRPNSALSSKSELDQAGPRPSRLVV